MHPSTRQADRAEPSPTQPAAVLGKPLVYYSCTRCLTPPQVASSRGLSGRRRRVRDGDRNKKPQHLQADLGYLGYFIYIYILHTPMSITLEDITPRAQTEQRNDLVIAIANYSFGAARRVEFSILRGVIDVSDSLRRPRR